MVRVRDGYSAAGLRLLAKKARTTAASPGDADFGGGVFRADGVSITGLDASNGLDPSIAGRVTLGFRAEDAGVTDAGDAEISAPIYNVELLGDATMVTVAPAVRWWR